MAKKTTDHMRKPETARAPRGARSGRVPRGCVRLTINMRKDLHKKLKHAAVDQETTIRELVERWVYKYL